MRRRAVNGSSPAVLVLAFGTYCDITLMESLLQPLLSFSRVTFLVDNDYPVTSLKGLNVERYEAPKELFRASGLGLADTAYTRVQLVTKYWREISIMQKFMAGLVQNITALCRYYLPDILLIPYTAQFLLFALPEAFVDQLPIYVLHYAPGYPNRRTPWLFDRSFLDDNFKIYESPAGKSGLENIYRSSMSSSVFFTHRDVVKRVSKAIHVACWPLNSTPDIKSSVPELKIRRVGGLYNAGLLHGKVWRTVDLRDLQLKQFVKRGSGKLMFVSLGSYGVDQARDLLKFCLMLRNACRGIRIVLHNTTGSPLKSDDANIYVHSHFVPYEWLVPKAACVISSGSLCLMTTCFYNKTPVIFLPVIPEQYFWARNYEYHTGVPFVTKNISDPEGIIQKAINMSVPPTRKLVRYLHLVSTKLMSHPGTQAVAVMVKKHSDKLIASRDKRLLSSQVVML